MTEVPIVPIASANYKGPVLFGLAVIFMTFGVAGGWAMMAPLDSAVVAQAVIAVENNRRTVQHLEGGIISEILVKDGQHIKEGDVLFRLDTTRAQASKNVEGQRLTATRILEARLVAERDDLPEVELPKDILEQKDEPFIAQVIEDQLNQFKERKSAVQGQIDILESRIQQAQTRIDGLNKEMTSTKEQIGFIRDELAGVKKLYEKGLVSNTRLLSLERERARLEGVIGRTDAEISGTEAVVGEAELQIEQIRLERLEKAAEQITEARSAINELREKLSVSSDVLRRTAILSPRSGTIIGLKVFTVGQVIRPADTLLEIVPDDEGLVLNAQVSPMDIERVTPNMRAEVKFSGFNPKEIPIVFGTVQEISPDRLIDEQTGMPYFLVQIIVTDENIPPQLQGRLMPGMPGGIVIPTGERTAMQYLIDPMQNAFRYAFRER